MQDLASPSLLQPFCRKTAAESLLPGNTLFCDFDGPIADVSDRYYRTYQLALEETKSAYAAKGISLPIRRLTKTQFWQMKQNRVPDTTIADWSGLSDLEVEEFLAQVQRLVNQSDLLDLDRLQPRAKTALMGLSDRGIRVVIVTLRKASQVLEFLHHHDLATTVSQIYGAQDTEAAYPNRVEHKTAQLKEAIAEQHRFGLSTTASWMIGDTEADVCAGHATGLPTLALTCGIRSDAYLKGFRPTYIARDLYSAVEYLLIGRSRKKGHSANVNDL